jgi:hypothetical protein
MAVDYFRTPPCIIAEGLTRVIRSSEVLSDVVYVSEKEELMERPDLSTLACVKPECHQFRQAGHGNLVVRKVYGCDRIRC